MSIIVISSRAYTDAENMRNEVRTALEGDREAAMEILVERFVADLVRMSDDQLAERILRDSSAAQLKTLHASYCDGLPEEEDERQTKGVIYGREED